MQASAELVSRKSIDLSVTIAENRVDVFNKEQHRPERQSNNNRDIA